jgi:GINS complex subunit 3
MILLHCFSFPPSPGRPTTNNVHLTLLFSCLFSLPLTALHQRSPHSNTKEKTNDQPPPQRCQTSVAPEKKTHLDFSNMSGSYYDIADILAEEERVPVVFDTPAQDLGYLVEGSQDRDVDENTKVELPYWLAEKLASKQYISFETPHYSSLKYRNGILADPISADLRQCCQVFYQLGMRVAPWLGLTGVDRSELEEDLVRALTERFHSILDHAQNSHNEDNTSFTNILSSTELELYWEGYAAAGNYIKWKHSRTQTLTHSWLIELHERRRKRRRIK